MHRAAASLSIKGTHPKPIPITPERGLQCEPFVLCALTYWAEREADREHKPRGVVTFPDATSTLPHMSGVVLLPVL